MRSDRLNLGEVRKAFRSPSLSEPMYQVPPGEQGGGGSLSAPPLFLFSRASSCGLGSTCRDDNFRRRSRPQRTAGRMSSVPECECDKTLERLPPGTNPPSVAACD